MSSSVQGIMNHRISHWIDTRFEWNTRGLTSAIWCWKQWGLILEWCYIKNDAWQMRHEENMWTMTLEGDDDKRCRAWSTGFMTDGEELERAEEIWPVYSHACWCHPLLSIFTKGMAFSEVPVGFCWQFIIVPRARGKKLFRNLTKLVWTLWWHSRKRRVRLCSGVFTAAVCCVGDRGTVETVILTFFTVY